MKDLIIQICSLQCLEQSRESGLVPSHDGLVQQCKSSTFEIHSSCGQSLVTTAMSLIMRGALLDFFLLAAFSFDDYYLKWRILASIFNAKLFLTLAAILYFYWHFALLERSLSL